MKPLVTVYGAGLAGSEAAWQAARFGCRVRLVEMKPARRSPAHSSDGFAELVCSNSLRSADITSGVGLLKEELRRLGSLIMEAADATRVAAGGALAVDRHAFSNYVTEKIKSCPDIESECGELCAIPSEGINIIATGPLTDGALAESIKELVGGRELSFFDAAAPIVDFSSIDMSKAFFASRYGKGTPDYINCPMNKEQYDAFYDALVSAEEAKLHDFETGEALKVFEGCMPVEVMARRGRDTLRYGPMKPVGIRRPDSDERYYAVVQLRRENEEGTMFNLVGFQTHLTFPEQRRVFRMIPGLENAEFMRYGVMHRNTFLNSPGILSRDYSMLSNKDLFFAGQMTGVEGYIESCASGFCAGLSAAKKACGEDEYVFPESTMIGAMAKYVSCGGAGDFQPMNANFGILSHTAEKIKGGKKERYLVYANAALSQIDAAAAKICEQRPMEP